MAGLLKPRLAPNPAEPFVWGCAAWFLELGKLEDADFMAAIGGRRHD
tara:strand:- start:1136 stop:1276 length:141 start_codon:yes stop_codon:yes gene_type:complete